jgi:hypothetical protein
MSDTRTGLPSRGGTLYAIQQAQLARERDHKDSERIRAARILVAHAREHGWPQDDLELVMGTLGLQETEETHENV